MKTRSLFYLTTLIIPMFLLLLPLVAWAAPPGTIVEGDYIDVSKQAWIEYEQPITDPLGHPQLPWLPKEDYPFKQPYTGVELAYLSYHDHKIMGGKYFQYSGILSRLNKRGLMIQRKAMGAYMTPYDHYRDAYWYDLDKDGKVGTHDYNQKLFLIYETPADVRGTSMIKLTTLNSPMAPWKMSDTWSYSPGLRRVTRSQGGDRQDEILGTPVTNDDAGDRMIWEEDHILIGEDVLYEQLLDPQIVHPAPEFNTGDFKKDGEWIKNQMDPSWGEEKMSPYRPDGGVECWVVLSKWSNRSKVFPDPKEYYLSKRIIWIEKVTKTPIREEQYDQGNRLIKYGYNINPQINPGGFMEGGQFRSQYVSYDFRRHFTSWGTFLPQETGPKAKAPDDWYVPEHLFKEYFWKTVKLSTLKSAKEFAPPPALYRAKFPKYRGGSQDWMTREDMEVLAQKWRNHGFTDEEVNAMQLGDGIIRKDTQIIPVRKHERPAFIHGKPLPVKFPNE